MEDIDKIKEEINKINEKLEELGKKIEIIMNPFQNKESKELFKNINLENVIKSILDSNESLTLTKTNLEKIKRQKLTEKERELLLFLYKNEQGATIDEISTNLNLGYAQVKELMNNLSMKGIIFEKKSYNGSSKYRMDNTLREF